MHDTLYQTYRNIEKTHWWFVGRRYLLGFLLRKYNLQHKKILDFGCNQGLLVGQLQSRNYDVYGCDISTAAIAHGAAQGVRNLRAVTLPSLPYNDNEFDVVLCLDTLEHIENDAAALRELDRITKPGGHIIITVPAFMFLWGLQDEVSHHFRRYTKKQLLVTINTAANWQILRCSYFNFLLFIPIYLTRLLSRVLPSRRSSDFDINNKVINTLLRFIFLIELWLLQSISYPLGVSLLLVARKQPVGISE